MFFKKRKQAQLERERKEREAQAALDLKNSIEKAKLLLDRCPTYEYNINYAHLETMLAAFPADKYELKIEKYRNYYGWDSTRYFIVKKTDNEKNTYYDARTHTYKNYEKEENK